MASRFRLDYLLALSLAAYKRMDYIFDATDAAWPLSSSPVYNVILCLSHCELPAPGTSDLGTRT